MFKSRYFALAISWILLGANSSYALESTAASTNDPGVQCKIQCNDPHPACAESQKVIETLKILATAYSHGDLKTYEEYLAEGCTTFDETEKKLITGKQAVLEDLKQTFNQNAASSDAPLLSLTIDQPYAKVNGDTAVVTFIAIKQIGGKHPGRIEAHCTDVFVKEKDTEKWKKLHFRGHWKKMV